MPAITAIYTSLLAILIAALGARVSQLRVSGTERDKMQRAIRAHGNLIENAPIFVLLLLCAELGAAPEVFLHAMGSTFYIGRIAHAWGVGRSLGQSAPRLLGIATTWTLLTVLAFVDMWLGVTYLATH